MTREYKKWKNRSTNKNEQLLKIQHYIKVRLLHDRRRQAAAGSEAEMGAESRMADKTSNSVDIIFSLLLIDNRLIIDN